ncbi:MAG: ABC transporter ATP-binding protein [bacterium]
MVDVESVSKRYGRLNAVSGVTFSVKEGEILGLLGPNGAGKTTLMRIITGYLPATSGAVRVGGLDAFDHALKVKRRTGYLPEIPPLYNDMTVASFLRYVCELKGIPRKRRSECVAAAMEKAGVAAVAGRLVGNLSRGFKQRVGLAQALLGDPPLLILDEPTVGMDPRQIIEIRRLIQSLRGSHTVIFSSHIITEVSAVCERVVILNRGRVLAEGTHEELVKLAEGKGGDGAKREPRQWESTESLYARASGLENVFLRLTADDAQDDDGGGDAVE